jgi:RNA polymerase sigma-70 factor (ECF subfamily)
MVALMSEKPHNGAAAHGSSDGSLVRRLKDGCEDAAKQLYIRYAKRLRSLARNKSSTKLARRMDAEDIVQSVFRIFFAGAKGGLYDVPDGEDLWKLLLAIALNKIRDVNSYHRAAKRDVRITAELERLAPATDTDDEEFAVSFLRMVVNDTLKRLSPAERQMIELRMDGYDMDEMCARLHRSKRTVERILQQARVRLKQEFDED